MGQSPLQPNNRLFWCSEKGQRNLDVVFSRSENCWTSVLYFTLYLRLLYDASCIIGCCVFGFHVPKCHVYRSKAGTLRCDVCMAQAELEHAAYSCLCLTLGDVMYS